MKNEGFRGWQLPPWGGGWLVATPNPWGRYLNLKTSQFRVFIFQKVLIVIICYNFSLNSIKILKIPMCLFFFFFLKKKKILYFNI
jgi:hypothetical protein